MATVRPDVPMPLGEHLHELRRRIVPPIIVFVVGCIVGFIQGDFLKQIFVEPLLHAVDICGPKVAGEAGIVVDQAQPFRMLKTFDLGESMWVTMSLAMWLGFVVAIPVVLHQLWQFIGVGLKAKERQLAFILVPVAVICFYAGATFGYYVGLPYFFAWFIEWQARDMISSYDLRLASYRDDFFFYTLVFGFLFDIPWAVVAVVRVGFVTPDQLAKFRKMVFFAVTIVAAIVTPPDPVSMLIFMAPTYLLFEVGLLAARIIGGPKKAVSEEPHD